MRHSDGRGTTVPVHPGRDVAKAWYPLAPAASAAMRAWAACSLAASRSPP